MAAEVLTAEKVIPAKWEPKRKYLWVLDVEGMDAFLLMDTQRPHVTRRRFGLGWRQQPIVSTLYDPIAPSAAQQVMEWVEVGGRRDARLKMLDPLATVVETWELTGLRLNEADFGTLSYAGAPDSPDDEPTTVKYLNSKRYISPGHLVTVRIVTTPRRVRLLY